MTTQNITQENENSVDDFLAALDSEQVINDCVKLIEIMSKVSGHKPKMWGSSIIGFGSYHYKYASGREGDTPALGFSPRKGKIAVYTLIEDAERNSELFAKLGKHSTSKACIYIKHLSEIDLSVFSQIMKQSYVFTKSLANNILLQ